MKTIDLTGRVVGQLTVLRFVESRKDAGGHARRRWLVRCSCGTEKTVQAGHLLSGATLSCGCLNTAVVLKLRTKHGRRWTPEYRTWCAMIDRCHREKNINFANYGGRGIRVCDEWRKSFQAFFDHVGPKPTAAHSIDRIDVDGNYEPGNVRWVTKAVQAVNTRKAKARAAATVPFP